MVNRRLKSPRSSLILIFFFRSFFRTSFSFLLLPCFLSTRLHSLPTVVQRTHKHLYHVHTPTPPTPLYNGGTCAKSISVWRLDFVHETDSYTNLSDSVCCVVLWQLKSHENSTHYQSRHAKCRLVTTQGHMNGSNEINWRHLLILHGRPTAVHLIHMVQLNHHSKSPYSLVQWNWFSDVTGCM